MERRESMSFRCTAARSRPEEHGCGTKGSCDNHVCDTEPPLCPVGRKQAAVMGKAVETAKSPRQALASL